MVLVGCSDGKKLAGTTNNEKPTSDHANTPSALLLAAEKGDPLTQFNLGAMYEYGEGVTQDFGEAIKWYRKSAEQGYPHAQFKVGLAYVEGRGVVANYAEGVKWYRRAAEQGDVWSQYNMGNCYQYGYGLPQSYEEAFKWYSFAAQQGLAFGQLAVGGFYRAGVGVAMDKAEAYKFYRLASAQKDANAWGKQASAKWREEALDWCERLSRELTPVQLRDAERRANSFSAVDRTPVPPTECTDVMVVRDESKSVEVRIHRILVGQRVADEGLCYQSRASDDHKRKKVIVYLEVSVSSIGGPQEQSVGSYAFTLEDSAGNSYACEQTTDYLRGEIRWGKTARGGIAFAVDKGCTPQKLIYNTGLVNSDTREKLFASVNSLNTLNVFRRPVGEW
ncbi:MAG: DUF4352 domain-containing protein [Verrucomicrobiota bacterium]